MEHLAVDSDLLPDLDREHPAKAAIVRRLSTCGLSSLCGRLTRGCPAQMSGEEGAHLFFRVFGRRQRDVKAMTGSFEKGRFEPLAQGSMAVEDFDGPQWPHRGCAVTRRRFPVGARPTRRFAPAGSNRSRHGGDEMRAASSGSIVLMLQGRALKVESPANPLSVLKASLCCRQIGHV